MPLRQTQGAPILTLTTSEVSSLVERFCAPDTSNWDMQSTVFTLTEKVVAAAQVHDSSLNTCRGATLIPVLRGGLPMLVGAQSTLPANACVLVRCTKLKATQDVRVEWLVRRPLPPREDEDGPLVLLDTVIATGDTMHRLCDELEVMPGCTPSSVIVMSCYAAPAALQRLAMHPIVKYIVVAREAERCDDDGCLVPSTNGDIGDKIYGARF
ncbi:carbon-nitrogen hydrolase [Apiospora arundinis]